MCNYEIIAIVVSACAGDRQKLIKVCDQLAQGEVTRELLLSHDNADVDSTTDGEGTPVKKPVTVPKVKKDLDVKMKGPKASRAVVNSSRALSAQVRAKELFKAKNEDIISQQQEEIEMMLKTQLKQQQQQQRKC